MSTYIEVEKILNLPNKNLKDLVIPSCLFINNKLPEKSYFILNNDEILNNSIIPDSLFDNLLNEVIIKSKKEKVKSTRSNKSKKSAKNVSKKK